MAVREGYKHTRIGTIPKDWNLKEILEFATIKTGPFGTLLKASEYSTGDGVPLISVGEIREGHFHISDSTPQISDAVIKRIPQYLLKKGEIVFGRKGGVERSALVREGQAGWFLGSDGICIRPTEEVDKEYLAVQLQSDRAKKWLLQNAIGTTMASLNQDILGKISIPFPPTKAEQESIAEALSDADGLIESLEQLISKKRQIKQGAMQELLRGERRLPGFEGAWKRIGLGESAILKARIGWQGLTTAEYRDSGKYCLVTGTEFENGNIDWSRCHFVSAHRYNQDPNIQVKNDDVLVTKDGTIGKVAIVKRLPMPATLNSGVFVIRPKEKAFDPSFFFYLLCSDIFGDFLSQLSAGSTINHLYQKDFVKFVFAVPPTTREQAAIATILSDMDAEIASLEAKLAKARKVKQGMMQDLLTGSIRLPFAQGCSEAKSFAKKPKHNRHFEDAAIIGTLVDMFGRGQYPLGRKRYTKLSYLLHRFQEQDTSAYLKKAAGPYNPTTRYGGAEKIAIKNQYVRQAEGQYKSQYKGFVPGENAGQAQEYFLKWYGPEVLQWLEQFRYAKTDDLELWATIDAAVQDVRAEGQAETLGNVKAVLQGDKEWVKKLARPVFSDENIVAAMGKVDDLFKQAH